MKKEKANSDRDDTDERRPYLVRLPGFMVHEDVGLGDVIKRATHAVGIRPCGGCKARATSLNRWMLFTRR